MPYSARPVSAIVAALVLAAAPGLAGCQSAAIDTTQTTAIGASGKTRGETELAEAKTHFRHANYGLAEKHFRKSVELDALDAEAWMGLAASYDQLGRFDFADRAYEQLLKLAGRRPQVVNNLGYSQLLRGNRAEARKFFEEARAGMADTAMVDANIALLSKG